MAKKEIKKVRFNFVMTEQELWQLAIIQNHSRTVLNKAGTTKGAVIRNLVSNEFKRIFNIN